MRDNGIYLVHRIARHSVEPKDHSSNNGTDISACRKGGWCAAPIQWERRHCMKRSGTDDCLTLVPPMKLGRDRVQAMLQCLTRRRSY